MDHFLSTLVFLPVLFAILAFIVPLKNQAMHGFGIFASLVLFIVSLLPWLQGWAVPSEMFSWFPTLGIHYALGADGLSMSLIVLTTFLLLMCSIASISSIKHRLRLYYSMLFLLVASVLGVFTARDMFLYFLFWELELIPMYLLIAIWGGPRRQYASMKFVLYTLFGSVFLVAGIVGAYFALNHGSHPAIQMDTFLYQTISQEVQNGHIALGTQLLLFIGFFITFAVKLPMVPFHTWLPDAHVEAPTPVSMMLAGIMLKMGAYGLLRICFGFFPEAAHVLAPYIALLAFINIVYTAGVALVQTDMKKLIAYSSVSHMGFVLLGLASLNAAGFSGATFVMISHGLVSAALFMCVGTLYVRTHTREILQYGGFGVNAPTIFYFFLFMSMASLGLPLLVSFAGESLVFYGGFLSHAFQQISLFGLVLPWSIQTITVMSAVAVILSAAYSLWLVKRVFYGGQNLTWANLTDATRSEVLVLATMGILVLWFGLTPNMVTRQFEASINQLLTPYANAQLPVKSVSTVAMGQRP